MRILDIWLDSFNNNAELITTAIIVLVAGMSLSYASSLSNVMDTVYNFDIMLGFIVHVISAVMASLLTMVLTIKLIKFGWYLLSYIDNIGELKKKSGRF